MIVLDTSVLVAHFDKAHPHHARATDLLIKAGLAPLAASAVTITEVLTAPARREQLPRAVAALRRLGVRGIPLETHSSESLALLLATTKLKLPDCCVIAAAEQEQATAIATFDDQLVRVARDRGITVHTIV